MDFLKAALQSSKQKSSGGATAGWKRKPEDEAQTTTGATSSTTNAEEPGAKRFKTRGEIEAERQAKLQAEKEERIRARRAAAAAAEQGDKRGDGAASSAASSAAASSAAAGASSSATPAASSPSASSNGEDAGMISAAEVKRRLRSYSEPITLFGETDSARFQRLKLFELVQHERATSSHGHKNLFAQILQQDVESEIKDAMMRDMEEQRKGQQAVDAEEADASAAAAAAAGGVSTAAASASSSDGAAAEGAEIDETGKVVKASSSSGGGGSGKVDYRGRDLSRSDFDSSEEFCLYFFKRLLAEWETELECRPKEVRMSAHGKMASATQKQTRQFIKPLFKLLKTRTCPSDILKACERMATSCLNRQYAQADEAYLTMAIGNAAWPLGVTMVSIHERAGRTKIFSQQVAHVLNDETQRKYIQSVKRLMTYCQDHYPAPYASSAPAATSETK